jgi:YD repeat-containing protein
LLETKVNAKGLSITHSCDEKGKLTERSYPDGAFVRFTYMETGKRETVEDFRGITRYGYDGRDRLAELVYPDSGKLPDTYDTYDTYDAETASCAKTRPCTHLKAIVTWLW